MHLSFDFKYERVSSRKTLDIDHLRTPHLADWDHRLRDNAFSTGSTGSTSSEIPAMPEYWRKHVSEFVNSYGGAKFDWNEPSPGLYSSFGESNLPTSTRRSCAFISSSDESIKTTALNNSSNAQCEPVSLASPFPPTSPPASSRKGTLSALFSRVTSFVPTSAGHASNSTSIGDDQPPQASYPDYEDWTQY